MKLFKSLFAAEMQVRLHDFFNVFFALIFPVMMLFLFGTIFEGGVYPNGSPMVDASVPAYCAMIMGVTGLMDLPLTLAHNYSSGIYKHFDATPAGKERVMLAELASEFVLTLLGIGILILCGTAFFDLHIHGTAVAVLGSIVLGASSTFATGFLFAAITKNPRITQLLSFVTYFVSIFLSGATLPSFLFPGPVRRLADCLPMTYTVDLLQKAFAGASAASCVQDALVLTTVGSVCAVLAFFLYRRRDWALSQTS